VFEFCAFFLLGWDDTPNPPLSLGCFPIFAQAYSPSEPPKPGDVFSRQNVPFNIGESQFSLPTCPQELIQRYQVL
jgi:hypothetical protein